MLYKNLFGVKYSWKTVSLLCFLAVFPNLLGTIHYITPFGVRIHFFQYLIFVAAIIYGPIGGMISGTFGSVYTAFVLNNPYIIVGNVILGGFTGLLVRFKWNIILAALCAYIIQLPWLWVTDIYLAHMPVIEVKKVVVALLISNALWAAVAGWSAKRIRNIVI